MLNLMYGHRSSHAPRLTIMWDDFDLASFREPSWVLSGIDMSSGVAEDSIHGAQVVIMCLRCPTHSSDQISV